MSTATINSIVGEEPTSILRKAFIDLKETICYNDPMRIIANQFRDTQQFQRKKEKVDI